MTSVGNASPVVLAAIDDDAHCAAVLACSSAEAARLGLPLRVVHVWSERHIGRYGASGCTADSDRLLSRSVYDNLAADVAKTVERQILHDDDPARALRALSQTAAVLVVGAGSGDDMGETTRRLAGRTRCRLIVVPAAGGKPA
ncbi:nucleotide-binding universal stress UspA family protein [Actinoplanes tereljensis]|uniref:universal stress protein n=1 Tax=Paractinoplanes tereljensis TaxID=571912 RepID=UPI001944900F|nr:universal stress protein [Actinoplanes tereljensis]